jgi:hypothetical protein
LESSLKRKIFVNAQLFDLARKAYERSTTNLNECNVPLVFSAMSIGAFPGEMVETATGSATAALRSTCYLK